MADDSKAHFIKAYFEDLQARVSFLPQLYDMGRRDEALMLCCCYIEALGSRQFGQEGKAKNYCDVLVGQGANELWRMLHPKQIKDTMGSRPLFAAHMGTIGPVIDGSGAELIDPDELKLRLDPHLNEQQKAWLHSNMFRGSIAAISYERIRSELVHDISAAQNLTFSTSTYKGQPVPELNFGMLFASLQAIVAGAQQEAVKANKWWFEA